MASVEQQRGIHTGDAAAALTELGDTIAECRMCPRLVEWREAVAVNKRASFADEDYWGKPVPGFGDPDARIVVVGLAPAAHGANRTGRMFTGDRSGDWLFRSLHTAGLANQPTSVSRDDGLELSDVWVTAPVRCAPPQNKPTAEERDNCAGWLDAELALLPNARVYVTLGQFGYHAFWSHLRRTGHDLPSPRPKFGHGLEVDLDDVTIVASYHVSQQNTFTGRLTEPMLDSVFARAAAIAAAPRL
ncbi:MAG: uracil-DNA glycosylase [Armatimonadetes bacterium]|nr:MAG: uracil-DNA glycosylase [Armatimonadota bacterium]